LFRTPRAVPNLRSIATVLEESVRRSGKRVRIAARLARPHRRAAGASASPRGWRALMRKMGFA
jgi:hypothetical protein